MFTNNPENKHQLNRFIDNYKHVWVLLYVFIYTPWFLYLEKTVTSNSDFNLIHCKLDDYIPFNELFVIPYIFWFIFVPMFLILFFFISKDEFYKLTGYMFIGMTICLLIYTIYPNGHNLRITEFPRDNILTNLIKIFYKTDTCTNVLPSIHSFNSIVIVVAVFKSKVLKTFRYYNSIKVFSIVSALLIMASTVIIKQHSILDMIAAIILSIVMYPFVYTFNYNTKKDDSTDMFEKQIS